MLMKISKVMDMNIFMSLKETLCQQAHSGNLSKFNDRKCGTVEAENSRNRYSGTGLYKLITKLIYLSESRDMVLMKLGNSNGGKVPSRTLVRWNAVYYESSTHGVERGKSMRLYHGTYLSL